MYHQPRRGCLRESARKRFARHVRYVFSTIFLRCTLLGWSTTRQARRCEIAKTVVTCWIARRRSAGIRIPPWPPLSRSGIECLFRNHTLEPAVLALQFFQALHRVTVDGSLLRSPLMQRHQGHAKRFCVIFKRLSLR
jgi:hypothetical protein